MKSTTKTISIIHCAVTTALASWFIGLSQPVTATPIVVAQSLASHPQSQVFQNVPNAEILAPPELEPGQVVFNVLLGEIALQRGGPLLASKLYAQLADKTEDPAVLERATELAGHTKQFDLAIKTAQKWVNSEPDSMQAKRLLVGMLVVSKRLNELPDPMIKILDEDKAALPINLLSLNRMFARIDDKDLVFRTVEQIAQPYVGLAEAHYAVALAAGTAHKEERALSEIQMALELRPGWELAANLGGQILAQKSPQEAALYLGRYLQDHPKADQVRLSLARMLVSAGKTSEAKREFMRLLHTQPDNPAIIYPVAILALQSKETALAEKELKHFVSLTTADDKDPAYFYLGKIAEEQKNFREALQYFAQVTAGELLIPARSSSAQILAHTRSLSEGRAYLAKTAVELPEFSAQLLVAESALLREFKQPETAFSLLETTLKEDPEQPDILYESAMLAEKLGKIDVMEQRLRQLIALQPDKPQAYNALGYSFAERNIRLDEAKSLIDQALTLSPDDGFILDSMGWLLYRQNKLKEALSFLQKAYAKQTDPEIAAHLGEILWALGRTDEAKQQLEAALKSHPDNEVLKKTVHKFLSPDGAASHQDM